MHIDTNHDRYHGGEHRPIRSQITPLGPPASPPAHTPRDHGARRVPPPFRPLFLNLFLQEAPHLGARQAPFTGMAYPGILDQLQEFGIGAQRDRLQVGVLEEDQGSDRPSFIRRPEGSRLDRRPCAP